MCRRRPCWPTPAEARRLIAAGYGDRMMLDWWEREGYGDDEDRADILLLCPAAVGHEGRQAPHDALGRCTFLTADELCEIHQMKPLEGAEAMCTGPNNGLELHRRLADTWDTEEGEDVVDLWQRTTAKRRARPAGPAQSATDVQAPDEPRAP